MREEDVVTPLLPAYEHRWVADRKDDVCDSIPELSFLCLIYEAFV